jgi:hypothetical protein
MSPKEERRPINIAHPPGMNPYRPDNKPHQPVFDLDLDLNPDL